MGIRAYVPLPDWEQNSPLRKRKVWVEPLFAEAKDMAWPALVPLATLVAGQQ